MFACMCVGGCTPAPSAWMCVWGGRHHRAQAQLHAPRRGQRDQPVRAPSLSDELPRFLSVHWDSEREGNEVEEEEERAWWTEAGEAEGWLTTEEWTREWHRSSWTGSVWRWLYLDLHTAVGKEPGWFISAHWTVTYLQKSRHSHHTLVTRENTSTVWAQPVPALNTASLWFRTTDKLLGWFADGLQV